MQCHGDILLLSFLSHISPKTYIPKTCSDLHKFNFESKYFLTNWWHFKQWICTSAFNADLYMWIFCVNICGVSVSYIYWILRNYFNFHHKYILSYCIMLWFIVLLMKLKYDIKLCRHGFEFWNIQFNIFFYIQRKTYIKIEK